MKSLPPYELTINDYVKFIITVNPDVEYSMHFKVHEVLSWECDDDNTPSDTELYMTGHIKWDGCSHVWFGEEDEDGKPSGYLHLCGKENWISHNILMDFLYETAAETIEKYDASVAE